MRLGVREICDVVLKAKTAQKIGNKVFYKDEPVLYFDSLKTSTLEQQANTVYAQGGRGNSRLIAWDGDRTVTFTMEDALISPIGISILAGAGLIEASANNTIKMHTTERTDLVVVTDTGTGSNANRVVEVYLSQKPYLRWEDPNAGGATGTGEEVTATQAQIKSIEDWIYVLRLNELNEVIGEPFIPDEIAVTQVSANGPFKGKWKIQISQTPSGGTQILKNDLADFVAGSQTNVVLVDYYVEKTSNTFEIDISPESFGCNFYLEASTLFRTTQGVDLPAEFVIPNCRVQSNFTFTMAASGDPSTFTFTMDAFPDYTRFNKTKKIVAAIQVIDVDTGTGTMKRYSTLHDNAANTYWADQEAILENTTGWAVNQTIGS